MQNGNCLLVSLPSVTAHTLPTTTTHAHLFDRTDQAGSLRQIQLLMDSYPTIVLAYDSKALKDLAARQIESLKFQFQDSDPIKLDIQEFGDSSASARARYSLGTGSLYFCDYQESLQQFFCMEGFVPVRDVIRTRRTGVIDTELLIRYRLSPSFMQKLTALPGGHQDTRIPAEAAESCSLCPHTTTKDQLQSSPQNALQLKVIPSSVSSCNRGANPEISGRPFLRIPGPGFAAIHRSLEDLKITGYIQHSTLLNGIEATSKVPLPLFVRGFNKFLDSFYSDYDFEAKLAVLHRVSETTFIVLGPELIVM